MVGCFIHRPAAGIATFAVGVWTMPLAATQEEVFAVGVPGLSRRQLRARSLSCHGVLDVVPTSNSGDASTQLAFGRSFRAFAFGTSAVEIGEQSIGFRVQLTHRSLWEFL